ncbi:hypothetical protein, partial [Neisseria meningitidis]|uniref:hypothetical protein n=1 Tax=Neisseria meningitidis TaxID=487 RepID=UPI001E4E5379
KLNGLDSRFCGNDGDKVAVIVDEQKPVRRCLALPYYLYCLRLRRLVLIFVNPLYIFGRFGRFESELSFKSCQNKYLYKQKL